MNSIKLSLCLIIATLSINFNNLRKALISRNLKISNKFQSTGHTNHLINNTGNRTYISIGSQRPTQTNHSLQAY